MNSSAVTLRPQVAHFVENSSPIESFRLDSPRGDADSVENPASRWRRSGGRRTSSARSRGRGLPSRGKARRWRGDGDVRYGLFRAIESVEAATADIEAILEATGSRRSTAGLRVAPTTAARWDLHGRLVALDDAVLDRVAKDGEWTIRETLRHIVGGQRCY